MLARAHWGDCGHDYFFVFFCKGRGRCPLCNTRRMVETAAHLTDNVFPAAVAGNAWADDVTGVTASPPGVNFYPASEIDGTAGAWERASLLQSILRAFGARGR